MQRLTAITTIVILMTGLTLPGLARSPQVSATVDRTVLGSGESLTLTVTIEGSDGNVDVSGIQDFDVVSRGTAQSLRIINGKTSREMRYTYVLVPLKEGALSIPALPVTIDKETFHTEAITIRVAEEDRPAMQGASDVFAEVTVSDPSPYVGQQVVCRVSLYHAVRIADAGLSSGPVFDGFTPKIVSNDRSYTKIISGRRYDVTELVYVLTPEQVGTFEVGATRIRCNVISRQQRNRGFPFDTFFDDTRLVPRVISANPVSVRVRPLPPYSGTVPFSGLVGEFDLSAKTDRTSVHAGDSVNLTVTIKGKGNVQDAPLPDIDLDNAFKVYADVPVDDTTANEDGVSGKKTFPVALVALFPGDYIIGPFSVVYFDTARGEYKTASTTALPITVLEADEESPAAVFAAGDDKKPPGIEKKEVQFIDKDIFPLKEGLDAISHRRPMTLWYFLALLAFPVPAYAVAGIVVSRLRRNEPVARTMAKQARAALAGARPGDANAAERLYKAIVYAIFARAGKKGESLTYKEARQLLRQSSCPEALADTAAETLEKVEQMRFGGGAIDPGAGERLFKTVKDLVRRLTS
ncbi:MAG: BatD family protein [Thermodesulfobacteriota bacterium]|nr:BatD family protein [Thermodesulfobacteriota bacterium]